MIGIYKITNPLGNIYIGQSVNIPQRWKSHKSKQATFGKSKICTSFRKYGHLSHTFEVLERCTVAVLNDRERFYQELFDVLGENGLNMILTTKKPRIIHKEEKFLGSKKEKEYLRSLLRRKNITPDEKLMYRTRLGKIILGDREAELKQKLSKMREL
jgi:group I intron endonuclease